MEITQRTMRAAILEKQHQPLVIDQVELPEKLAFGQVLVKVAYTGICGSQIGEIDGVKGEDRYLPHLLGHEGSGVVEAVGPGVKHVKVGDHVVMHWMKGQGLEAPVPSYRWNDKPLNAGWITTFNEYAIISENRLTAIPSSIDLNVAALLGCAVTTGLGMVNNNAVVKIGQSVVVLGAGGVGLSVVQGASLVSAYPIIAVDLYDEKLQLARHFGATHCINSSHQDLESQLKELLPQKADVIFDNTGHIPLIEMAYNMTKPQGKTVLAGVPRQGNNISIFSLQLHFGKVLTGSHGGETNPTQDIPRYLNLYQAGKLDLQPMITDEFAFEDINQALDQLRKGQITGRCLLKF